MSNLPLISIIIPVYNTGDLLTKCIESISIQTYKNIEILIVDDGSTDDSANVIEKAIQESQIPIHSFYQENSGQATARNKALNYVSGSYVMFLDSDDWLSQDTILTLYMAMTKNDADIAMCDFETINQFGEVTGQYSSGEIKNGYVDIKLHPEIAFKLIPQVTGKLFKTELFHQRDITFPEGIWYEDLALLPIIVLAAQKVVKVEKYFYKYFKREGSTTMTNSLKVLDATKAIDFIKVNLPKRLNSDLTDKALNDLVLRTLYITAIRLSEIPFPKQRKQGFNLLYEYRDKNFALNQVLKSNRPFSEKAIVGLLSFRLAWMIGLLKKIKRK